MARGNKFGTFGGVFTPAILTILGVIMYMRLPWLVGTGGLYLTLGIIIAAHVISVTTGLSVASIATDKKVKAGGPYYIVSRSLGLPIGGTLGMALFVGLSFSVSLYVIGFSESFLDYWGLPKDPDTIRLCGTATLFVLTIITLISTALALKIQYVIMLFIGLSLISIVGGSAETTPAEPALTKVEGADVAVLFAIFFPAVTGFTAGVNMSGDLQDPKRSLPRGTLLAIFVGLATYIGLTFLFAYRMPRELMIASETKPDLLLQFSWVGEFVVAGVWGATLSSALGSILGAPRILQAKSIDRITPAFFAKGYGKANEPRNALLVTFGIAEAGILIGELNVIANIVSMFFIMTYGFLNLSCAIESWASPDFRPDFRIPKTVSVIGAIACVLVMIQINFLAMIAATAILAGLFLYFKRRELTLESGDTWDGVWSSIVRSGLSRLTRGGVHQRNWRPNIVLFSEPGAEAREPLLTFGQALVSRRGVLTDFELVPTKGEEPPSEDDTAEELPIGMFRQRVRTENRFETMAAVCRFHGFSGMEPNTVLIDWEVHRDNEIRFAGLLDSVATLDFNLLLFAFDRQREFGERERIDVWWSAGRGSIPLSLALIRFLTSVAGWQEAHTRFLLIDDDSTRADTLYKTTQQLLTEARVEASVKVITNAVEPRPYEEWIRQESADADLTFLALPDGAVGQGEQAIETMEELLTDLGSAVLVHPSSQFPEVFADDAPRTRPRREELEAAETDAPEDLGPEIELPATEALAAEVTRFAEQHGALVESFHSRCIAPAFARQAVLIERLQELVERHFGELERGLIGRGGRRLRRFVAQVHGALLSDAKNALTDWGRRDLDELRDRMEAGLENLAEWCDEEKGQAARVLVVERARDDFLPDPQDPGHLRRFKRRRRLAAWLRRRPIRYSVRVRALYAWHLDHRTRTTLHELLQELAREGYEAVLAVSKALTSIKTNLARVASGVADRPRRELVRQEKASALAELAELAERSSHHAGELRARLIRECRQIQREFSADIGRLDVQRLLRKERRIPRASTALAAQLGEVPGAWLTTLRLVLHRAELGVLIAGLQHRLGLISEEASGGVVKRLQGGVLAAYEKLAETLRGYRGAVAQDGLDAPFKVEYEFESQLDHQRAIDDLVSAVQGAVVDLPQSLDTLSDESIAQLVEGDPLEDVEVLTLSLRQLVEYLIELEFVARLKTELSELPLREQEAIRVAQDVVRLISFNLADFEFEEDRDDEAFRVQMEPVVEDGITRLEGELEKLSKLVPRVTDRFETQRKVIVDRTDAYAITGSADTLKRYIRARERHTKEGLLARARGAVVRLGTHIKDGLATLIYRRSAGVLLARRLRHEPAREGTVVERVLELAQENSPRREVLEGLPFYYQQLFLGKSAVNEAFWVGRQEELAEAGRAVANYQKGFHGALVVTGRGHSGKTALARQIAAAHFDKPRIHQIFPPRGGSIEPRMFKERLQQQLKVQGSYGEIFQTLPESSALVLHDVELWWERSEVGLAVINTILDLIDRYGERCFFILELNDQAFRLINRFVPLADKALAVIESRPFDASSLKEVLSLRHGSTGLKFELGGKGEDAQTDFRLARLFARYFTYSRGYVGPALQAWIANIEEVDGSTFSTRPPQTQNLEVLLPLRMDWLALLLELVLHKQVGFSRLARLTELPEAELRREVNTLIRMGLVVEDKQAVIEINRFVHHMVVAHLSQRGVLA